MDEDKLWTECETGISLAVKPPVRGHGVLRTTLFAHYKGVHSDIDTVKWHSVGERIPWATVGAGHKWILIMTVFAVHNFIKT